MVWCTIECMHARENEFDKTFIVDVVVEKKLDTVAARENVGLRKGTIKQTKQKWLL